MITETIEDEITTNGNRKTMLGVRCFAELKFKLTEEAQALGITLSEHCESILLNKDALFYEKEEALAVIEELRRKVDLTTTTLDSIKSQHITELQKVKGENDRISAENIQLKKNDEVMKKQVALFTNKRLLFLFEKVKGQKDIIDGADGEKYSITYNQPKDLLEAMIYSFNLKKP
jgi:hypothetical protein